MTVRRSLLSLPFLLPSLSASAGARRINATRGVAVRGFDVVAYVSEGRALRGEARHAVPWGNATWRFASAARAQRFEDDPEAYAPRFGGFCAYGVSRGYLADVDPQAFSVVEGRLYLNYSLSVRREWSQDIPGHIARAETNWPRLSEA